MLVKDERHYDRYDRVFAAHFKGLEQAFAALAQASVPEEWLRRMAELTLSPEERAKVEALGGFEQLMEALKERLREQQGRHEGGSKWIGTAGRSPFGAYGYNPEGVRIGQDGSRNRSAVKVWDRREFRNLDDSVELGTRNIKLALRRLRRFAREGAAEELDLGGTIDATARNAGWLDLKLVPERHNAIKVLLFLDVGGSMDDHVRACEELFTAARSEFKHLEYYYFHNFVYETVWKDNSPPPRRAHPDAGGHAHLRPGLPAGVRRRRDHEPVRDRAAGRQHRALERRGRRRVARAPAARLPQARLAQPRAAGPLGLRAVDRRRARSCSTAACTR